MAGVIRMGATLAVILWLGLMGLAAVSAAHECDGLKIAIPTAMFFLLMAAFAVGIIWSLNG